MKARITGWRRRLFCEGKHWHNAVQALDHVLTHELSRSKETQRPERLSEAYFLLGEAQRQDKVPDAAEKAYTSCLGVVAPTVTYAFRARYQLALLKIDEGKVDEAYDLLDQNTKQFPYAAKADAETKEKTLFALGNLSFQRKNYAKVYGLLEQALEHFPANPDATLAHFQLAESYLQIALQAQQTELIGESRDPSTVESLRKEYTRWLKKAAFEFEALAEFLEKPEGANQLTLECQVDVPFKAAACRFHLNEYDLAAASYEKLYAKYPDRLEGLNALGGAVQCYFLLDQRDKGFDRLKKIREMLTLPTIPEKVRGLWEAWVDEVTARVANTNKRRG
jgi:tetratricopeptide (TPR) repeat protein